MAECGVYGSNIAVIPISEIYEVYVSVCILSGGQKPQPPVIFGQVLTTRIIWACLLFSDELYTDYYNAPLPVEHTDRPSIFD
jgi:hypothetical protein